MEATLLGHYIIGLIGVVLLLPAFLFPYRWGLQGGVAAAILSAALYRTWLEIPALRNHLYALEQLDFVGILTLINIVLSLGVGMLDKYSKNKIKELKESQGMYRHLIEISSESMMIYSEDKIAYINRAGMIDLGASNQEEVIGKTLFDFIHSDYHQIVRVRIQQAYKQNDPLAFIEQKRIRLDGTLIDVESSTVAIQYKDKPALMIVTKNVSERKRHEEQIQQLSYYDTLTGLPNRSLLNDRLTQAIAQAKRKRSMMAVMLIDLDRFKYINDTLGHFIGDLLLQDVSKRLKGCVRGIDTIARIGGDEFTAVLTDISRLDCMEVAKRMLSSLSQPYTINAHELFVTPSIGISFYPDDGETIEDLIKHAETAMYRAKEEGKNNFQYYTLDMDISEQVLIENALNHSLKRNEFQEFSLHYQPKVDINTGELTGMEALIRWEHPKLGIISPAVFIPLAEETGLILQIGEWVLKTACQQNKRWQEEGLPPMRVSVNLSARQIHNGLVNTIEQILKETSLDPEWLELEITEGILMEHVEKNIAILHQLRAKGISISIDDFGTGYSSLAYLKRFPVDIIKIDQSFIRNLSEEPEDISIVRAVITLGHSFNMKVIAEGVETAEQLQLLKRLKCNEMQGYLYSKPLSVKDFELMLKEQWKEDDLYV